MTCGAGHPEFGVPCLVDAGHRCPHQVYYRDRLYEWADGTVQSNHPPGPGPGATVGDEIAAR